MIGLTISNLLRYWRSCAGNRCRRARQCRDFQCYWRRLAQLPFDEQMRVRSAAEPVKKLLRIGASQGSEGRPLY